MFAQKFFKIFPPPKFLDIPYAGLDISDDAVRCIEYSRASHGFSIRRFGVKLLPHGVVQDGEIKDPKVLRETIAALARELKVYVVKASLPEEKMYLFATQVPSTNKKEIRQNVEFKLEENVPLTVPEAIFFFDPIPTGQKNEGNPKDVNKNGNLVSVSVSPRNLVISYLETIKSAGVSVLAFEVQAKAIARSLVAKGSIETEIIVYIMNHKTGLYVMRGAAVCFTSTINWGHGDGPQIEKKTEEQIAELRKQIAQVIAYWSEHGGGTNISKIILSGRGSLIDGLAAHCSPDPQIPVEVGNVWGNTFSNNSYIPPISYEDSLDYGVAAGLALPTDST